MVADGQLLARVDWRLKGANGQLVGAEEQLAVGVGKIYLAAFHF